VRTAVQPEPASAFFRRRFRTRLRRAGGRPDAVPLLGVALVLALFLVRQSAFVVQPAVRVELPAAAFRDGVPYGDLVVTLSQEGLVFFNDERTTLQGLRTALAAAARGRAGSVLLVEADARVSNVTPDEVYDMARAVGIREIALATRLPGAKEARP